MLALSLLLDVSQKVYKINKQKKVRHKKYVKISQNKIKMAKIKVTVGTMEDVSIVRIDEGSSVEEAFEMADISVDENSSIQMAEGGEVSIDDEVEAGKTYILVAKMKAGY